MISAASKMDNSDPRIESTIVPLVVRVQKLLAYFLIRLNEIKGQYYYDAMGSAIVTLPVAV